MLKAPTIVVTVTRGMLRQFDEHGNDPIEAALRSACDRLGIACLYPHLSIFQIRFSVAGTRFHWVTPAKVALKMIELDELKVGIEEATPTAFSFRLLAERCWVRPRQWKKNLHA